MLSVAVSALDAAALAANLQASSCAAGKASVGGEPAATDEPRDEPREKSTVAPPVAPCEPAGELSKLVLARGGAIMPTASGIMGGEGRGLLSVSEPPESSGDVLGECKKGASMGEPPKSLAEVADPSGGDEPKVLAAPSGDMRPLRLPPCGRAMVGLEARACAEGATLDSWNWRSTSSWSEKSSTERLSGVAGACSAEPLERPPAEWRGAREKRCSDGAWLTSSTKEPRSASCCSVSRAKDPCCCAERPSALLEADVPPASSSSN